MLGRHIEFKVLENRMQQMWAQKGIINIIDLGQEFFLVTFTSEEGQEFALMEGSWSWMIYDHYLTVRDWRDNFCLARDAIEELAIWVRIYGLPIEYYDNSVLSYIVDQIGKTVKVDKNTLTRAKIKYVRLCIQVNLMKLLLAMLSIKGHHYKDTVTCLIKT
ncbi:uncharacterized protein LOC131605574 [Vicia villosa]|uniref:uncharacterized protein LOC131605574 n=1 Tax=Vicia villosa TaxID=3911 RepID=UPI00273BF10A|nr:uncharacterized protein LOC131605574 [Vicia villosa]